MSSIRTFVDEGLGHSSYVIDLGDGASPNTTTSRSSHRPPLDSTHHTWASVTTTWSNLRGMVTACDRDSGPPAVIVDMRPIAEFAAGHVPGSISNALRPVFASWLGWTVGLDSPVVVIAGDDQDRDEIVRRCLDIGHDNLVGELDGGLDAWRAAGGTSPGSRSSTPPRSPSP